MKFAACLCICAALLCAADPAKTVFDRAVQALVAKDYPAAERGFESVLREQPGHIGALGNLGIVYSRTGRADKAVAVYRRALKISPDDQAILLNFGLVYLKQELHQRALPLFERVVALDPQNRQARQLVALCRLYTGQTNLAIRDLESMRSVNPRDEQILFLLGFAYLKNHDSATARTIFNEMFEVAGRAQTQFLFGKACYEAALFDCAEESYLEVQRLDPKFQNLDLALGKLYISQRRIDEAIRELKSALTEDPGDEDANYFLGSLFVQQARDAEGLPYLEKAQRQQPDTWSVLFYLGKAKLRLGEPAEAVVLLRKAVELNPDEAPAYYQLGRALQSDGRQAEAREAFRRVRELKAKGLKEVEIPGIR